MRRANVSAMHIARLFASSLLGPSKSRDHAKRLLLQSDFVPSAEPSAHSGRRIAFAVSPHHFAPLFIGRERYGSGNSTLNYTTDVRNVGRAPDGEGGRYRSRPQNRNPISRSENFWQMAFCPRISESRLTTPNACSTFKGLPNVTARCDVQLPEVMLQTSERPPFPAGKSLTRKYIALLVLYSPAPTERKITASTPLLYNHLPCR